MPIVTYFARRKASSCWYLVHAQTNITYLIDPCALVLLLKNKKYRYTWMQKLQQCIWYLQVPPSHGDTQVSEMFIAFKHDESHNYVIKCTKRVHINKVSEI